MQDWPGVMIGLPTNEFARAFITLSSVCRKLSPAAPTAAATELDQIHLSSGRWATRRRPKRLSEV